MIDTNIIKCPRCKLPQKGTYRCQYCGLVFSKNKLLTKSILNNLKDVISGFNKNQISATKKPKLKDSAGTRSGTDRRKFTMMHHYPERRSGKDRRRRIKRKGQLARKTL
jgi:hypothetical protein